MARTLCAALAVAAVLSVPARGVAAGQKTPVLIELFTSEGCSSCPPADTFLQRLADTQPLEGVQVIALGHHVTYWDHQGWKDRFSALQFTGRQEQYGSALRVESIYTPQMIVDGRFQFVGSDTKAGRDALDRAAAMRHGDLTITVEASAANKLAVSVNAMGLPMLSGKNRADIMLAITEDGLRSNVRAGENNGRTLVHAAVVRRLTTIGEASGQDASARSTVALDREWQRANLKAVAFVQERSTRHILASGVAAIR
jgi:hypothetical protein